MPIVATFHPLNEAVQGVLDCCTGYIWCTGGAGLIIWGNVVCFSSRHKAQGKFDVLGVPGSPGVA